MIEVLKQSAEDVSKVYDILAFGHTERALEILAKTRTSLRQAIAELESQEPDWKDGVMEQQEETILWQAKRIAELIDTPSQRTWVGLTDEEIRERWFAAEPTPDGRPASYNYARAIEAKLKEKNT